MKSNDKIQYLLETTLRHLYNAEKNVLDNLKVLTKQAETNELHDAFVAHISATNEQILRLERVFHILEIDPKSNKIQGIQGVANQGKEILKSLLDFNFTDSSTGMNGILSEGKELMRHFADTEANDIALIGAAHQVECYEAAYYRFVIFLAEYLQMPEVADLMSISLDEELVMADRLINIAKSSSQTTANGIRR